MAFALASSAREPLSEINTTPLIDVLLVLLIVFVMSIPAATHSLDIPLPRASPPRPGARQGAQQGRADRRGRRSCGTATRSRRRSCSRCCARPRASRSSPSCSSSPRPHASYELSAQVLNVIKGSGVTQVRLRRQRAATGRSASRSTDALSPSSSSAVVGAHRRAGERLGLEQQLLVGRALRQALAADHRPSPAPPAG